MGLPCRRAIFLTVGQHHKVFAAVIFVIDDLSTIDSTTFADKRHNPYNPPKDTFYEHESLKWYMYIKVGIFYQQSDSTARYEQAVTCYANSNILLR